MRSRICGLVLMAFAGSSAAVPISGGETVPVTVMGTTSFYQIFGHSGSPAGGGPATDAILLEFAAGAGNVFTFTAAGLVECCTGLPNLPPPTAGEA